MPQPHTLSWFHLGWQQLSQGPTWYREVEQASHSGPFITARHSLTHTWEGGEETGHMSNPWHPVLLRHPPWDRVTRKHNLRPLEGEDVLSGYPHFCGSEAHWLLACLPGCSGTQDYACAGEPLPLGGLVWVWSFPGLRMFKWEAAGGARPPLRCSLEQTQQACRAEEPWAGLSLRVSVLSQHPSLALPTEHGPLPSLYPLLDTNNNKKMRTRERMSALATQPVKCPIQRLCSAWAREILFPVSLFPHLPRGRG